MQADKMFNNLFQFFSLLQNLMQNIKIYFSFHYLNL